MAADDLTPAPSRTRWLAARTRRDHRSFFGGAFPLSAAEMTEIVRVGVNAFLSGYTPRD